jgi:hypothetical protein
VSYEMETAKDTESTTFRASTDSHSRSDLEASNRDVEKQSIHNNHEESTASPDEKTAHDPNIVNWNGPTDPMNPMNWTTRKKITAVALASMCTFLS